MMENNIGASGLYTAILLLLIASALPVVSGCAAGAATGALGNAGTAVNNGLTLASSTAQTVSSPSVFQRLSTSTKVPFISPAALYDDSPVLEADVVWDQCKFHTPDPVFFVPAPDQKLYFAGRLGPNRNFQSMVYKNILAFGFGTGTVQLNTWPLQLASLAQMPQLYLDHRLTLPSTAKLPKDEQREMVETYMEQAQRIQAVVSRLERNYVPRRVCPPYHQH
ncbi:MAG: hypothetical protein ACREP6_09215 [Candidatus Binataceae bacterium]